MAMIKYEVWSHHPPALAKMANGRLKVAAGTITKLTAAGVEIPATQPLPAHTTLEQFMWRRPERQVFQPQVRKVEGSKGKTYIIKSTPSGKWECNCAGYSFRRTCKHIQGV